MGSKYASIHVFGEDHEKILLALEKNNKTNEFFEKMQQECIDNLRKKLSDDMPDNHKEIMKSLINSLGSSVVLLIKMNKCISIYDESNSFETIQGKAKSLSVQLDYPILYISNFDDDVFLIGVYKSGKLVTSGNIGSDLQEYGLKNKNINTDKLCDTIQLKKTDSLATINSLNEIDEIEQIIEEYLHIPLDLDIETVESDTKYEKTFSNSKYHVFTKIIK